MKHNKTTSLPSQGFTLVELLVVIGIIAILATIAVPVGQGVLKRARNLQASAQMKSLEMAVKGYQTEYNRLPSLESPPPAEDNTEGYDTGAEDGRGIIEILTAADSTKNPRGVSFYEPPVAKNGAGYTSAGGLKDIWGANGYMIIFDYNGDKKITNPYGDTDDLDISASTLIYCAGANKAFDTGGGGGGKIDDIKSWE
jgi:prepilin-type N-terminal cleavage/methylation domain-containing protein